MNNTRRTDQWSHPQAACKTWRKSVKNCGRNRSTTDLFTHRDTHAHMECTSKTTDCVTDECDDGRRAQFAMDRSCCIDHKTAKPCQWCWRPAVCELPVSSPTRQPAPSRMIGWPTGMWCATVLDRVQPWSVSWVAERISSCWPWRCPCNALVDHTVGVCLTTAVRRKSALVSDCRPCE